jgi:hypothetical protein
MEPGTRWEREMRSMRQQVEQMARHALLVEDAAMIEMMGMPVLEALPSRGAPYERVDPFVLVHEARFSISSEMATKDTKPRTEASTTSGTC